MWLFQKNGYHWGKPGGALGSKAKGQLQTYSNRALSLTVQFSGPVVPNSLRPHGLQYARLPSLSFTVSWSLLKLMSIESVMPANHLIFCHPLLLLPSICSSIRVFSSVSLFTYLLGCAGSWLWQVGSAKGLNPSPLHWECEVLATGPPGKSLG